jgi:hypothetical protein
MVFPSIFSYRRKYKPLVLSSLVERKKIIRHGNGKATYYDLNE